ncbi:MAG TPA: branched-chain amino acid ABC transporter permease [Chloroflexia bacterium]|nr:branched-chain amino acid ABC transporter permease [Chloroflexia bacterium]
MAGALSRNRSVWVTVGLVALLLLWMSTQYKPQVTASILLSGLTLGALYFLVTSGLSLIFGLMDVLNFAHGLFFMFGAYVGYTLYANPRLILNTLPLALALVGGLIVGGWLAGLRPGPARDTRAAQLATAALGLAGGGLAVAAVWGFDLLTLGAPTGGTGEPAGPYLLRVLALSGGGLLLGLLRGWREPARPRAGRRGGRGLAIGALTVALAVILVYTRVPGASFLIALSSNLRFVLALAAGAAAGAALGGLIEWSLIRPLYVRPIYQVLLTLGLVFVGTEAVKGIWGATGFNMEMPAQFATRGTGCRAADLAAWITKGCASIDVLGRPFPTYRLFLILLGGVMFVAIALLLRRSRLGMVIRAGVQDSEMVQALGINVRWVFTLVFALGTGLAALGGVAAAPFIGVYPEMGQEFLLLAFIAVVIGGMGSYSGAALGALLVGLARAFGDQLVTTGIHLPGLADALTFSPSIARASTVLLMAVVLLARPAGLFGKKDS